MVTHFIRQHKQKNYYGKKVEYYTGGFKHTE